MTKRIAVVGIDGCGKSTLVRKLLTPGTMTMTCPLYHDTPNAPLAELSRQLDVFSRAADQLGSFELKATALYLQMTLYGPVERFLVETFRPEVLISERHALIDSLAYGPFYLQMLKKAPDRKLEPALREKIDYDPVAKWAERCGTPLWDTAMAVRDVFLSPDAIHGLAQAYQTGLPEVVCFLDIDPEVAIERIKHREEKELHEKVEVLAQLRQSYLQVMDFLRPHVEVKVLEGEYDLSRV